MEYRHSELVKLLDIGAQKEELTKRLGIGSQGECRTFELLQVVDIGA